MHQRCAAYSSGVPLTSNGSQLKQIEANQCKSKPMETIRFSGVPLTPAVCRLHQRCTAYIMATTIGPTGLKRSDRPQKKPKRQGPKRNDHDDLTPAVCHSAVCRSHQRCAIATIACTSGADISRNLMPLPIRKPLNRKISEYMSKCRHAERAAHRLQWRKPLNRKISE